MLFVGVRERRGSVVCGCERERGVLFVGVTERGECCLWV